MVDQASHVHRADLPEQESISRLIEAISAYIEQVHGGWVRLVDFDGEVLKVELGGACDGCHLSETTLHGWVEGTVRQFFPNLKRVEDV